MSGRNGSIVTTRRRLHLAVIAVLLVGHTLIHYAILLPVVGEFVEHLPFFNLHVLHEAEYLAVIAYASLVFRFLGGIVALLAFVIASIPFVLASRIDPLEFVEYGFAGPGQQLIEVVILLAVGVWIIVVNELWGRERDGRVAAMERTEVANRQLRALNETIQAQVNTLFETVGETVDRERAALDSLPPGIATQRLGVLLDSLSVAIRR